MKKLMTASLMTVLFTGAALMAQTGKAPATAPAAAVSGTATPAPAPTKVKKHHKAKKTTPDAAATNAAPVKK